MDTKEILSQMTLEEKADFCSGADFWKTKTIERLGVPAVLMSDGPHGLRKQQGEADHLGINKSIPAVCFPTASALAASFDVELAERTGEALGEECQAEDTAMLLGPGVNIKRSPLCGRNFEYFSEDPYLAGKIAAAMVRGIQQKDVAACVKHFAANNQETMRLVGDSVVDERTLHEIYLAPFETIVKEAQPRSIMCAYNRVNGTFMAENKTLLTDVLREKWGFDGFVVTDWGAVKDAAQGVRAGLDLVMPGGSSAHPENILAAVQAGELGEDELDTAVLRMLEMVAYASAHKHEGAVFDLGRDYALAVSAAKECAVLLKNDDAILPLAKTASVAFIGEFAAKPRYQGAGSSFINSAHTSSALDAAKALGVQVAYAQGYAARQADTDDKLLQKAVKAAKEAEVAVIFAGLPNAFETEGVDRTHLDMPANQNALIEAVAAVQPNTVVVLHNGAPVTMPWLERVPAVLEMYLAGDGAGDAAAALLFGDANPSGKLAESFPARLEDTPAYPFFPGENGRTEYREGVFVGYRYYDKKAVQVLFPFGHGLSYTSFAYSGLSLDKTTFQGDETLTLNVTVTNTGDVAGKEVVQLYVRPKESKVIRPIRELKGFKKVELAPGERKTVCFELDKTALSYYEPRMGDWYAESGEYAIEVGASSRDIRLAADVSFASTAPMPVVFGRYSTMGEILATEHGRKVLEPMMQAQQNAGGVTSSAEEMAENLGEGSEQMMQAAMRDMPLAYMLSFGTMNEEQLQGLIAALNAGPANA